MTLSVIETLQMPSIGRLAGMGMRSTRGDDSSGPPFGEPPQDNANAAIRFGSGMDIVRKGLVEALTLAAVA